MGVGNLFCQVPQPPDPGSELVSELVIRCPGLTGTTCVPDILSLVAIVTTIVRSMSRRAKPGMRSSPLDQEGMALDKKSSSQRCYYYFCLSKIKELTTPVCLRALLLRIWKAVTRLNWVYFQGLMILHPSKIYFILVLYALQFQVDALALSRRG
jgi:Na+-transporting NADH:ubiquinone oxidoreductase subunit NqrD